MAGEKTTGTSVVKRLLRWLVRIGVVLVIAGLLFYIVVLPSLVERVAISTLEAMGLPDVKLELRGLSIRHAQLANLAAGEGDRLFVGGIGLRYSVLELLRGEVEAIELTGVEVDVRIRDGVLDLGPIDDYLAQESTTEGFPVGRIDLRSSTIALDIEGTSLRLPLRGIAAKWSDGRVGVSVWVGGSDLDVHMEGAFDPDSFDADISTHIEWRDAGALVKALLSHVAPALHLGGSAEIDITCRRQDGNTDIGAEGCIRDVTIGQGRDHAVVTADELTIEAGARFEGADVDEVDVDVEIHGVRAAAFPSPLAGTLRFNWPRPKTAHGLAAHFDRLEGTLLSANVRGSDCSVWLDVSAPSLTAWWNGESDAEIELAVYGRLGKVLRRLAPAFIDEFGEPGKLSLKGRAAARLTRTDGAITSWRLETSDSRLTLEQGAGVPTQILSGVTADLSFAIEANPNEAALSVKSLSPIGFHAPVFDLGIAQVAFEGADRPAIQIPFGGTAAVRFGETIDWDAHAKLSLWAKGGRFRAPDGTLSGLDADVSLSLDATPERVRASIGSGTQLRVGSVRLDSGAFDIQPVGYEAPLLTAKLAGAAAVVSADLATLAWTLSATDVALSMPEAVVTCVEPRVKADGLALAAKLNLAVAPGKLEATIQPGAELVLKSLATDAIRIEQDKSTPLIRLASEEKQGTLAVTLVEQELSWRADLPEVALDLAAESVSLPDGPTVRKPTLSLRFGAAAVQDKLSLTLQDGSCVVIDRAEALIGEDILRLDAARFALQAHAEHPLVELRLDTAPREIRIALPVRAESPIKVALGTRARGAATSVGTLFLVGVDGRSADVKASLSIAGADVAAQHKVGSDMLKVDIDDWSLQADVSGKGPIDALPLEATFALTSSGKSKALTASMGDIAASLGKVELKGEGRL
ncbi:hypothetical protein HQ560_00175, partial [bacterium]|nr:hypothetical protein [bacterium]